MNPTDAPVDYQSLVEHHPFILNRFLPDTTLVYANQAMANFFGVSPDALIGQRWLTMVSQQERSDWLALRENFSPESPCHRIVNQVNDGQQRSRWIEWINTAFFNETGELTYFQAVGIDVTQRILAQNQLQENEARYSLAQQTSGFGIWDWYPQRDQIIWDDYCYQMLGFLPSEEPLTFADWQARLHPEDRQRCTQVVQQQLNTGHEFIIEFRYQAANGYSWVQGRGRVVERNAEGAPTRLIGVHLDIHALKETQLDLTRSNQDLEQFAYAISHDLRQPLRMVNSYLQLLTRELGDNLSGDAQQMIKFARQGAERMDNMILGILSYSRIGRKTSLISKVDSRQALDEVLSYLAPLVSENGGTIEVQGDWPEVSFSRDELVRLLQNLLHNALKYVDPNTQPKVIIRSIKYKESWKVEVRDNGIGIEPDQQDRLFRVFSRLQTRDRFDGTGIGLAVSKRIVEHHGGTIGVSSQGEGFGSIFYFTVPIRIC
ncbi:sensor histidine kinase [Vreelandella aquamarina]